MYVAGGDQEGGRVRDRGFRCSNMSGSIRGHMLRWGRRSRWGIYGGGVSTGLSPVACARGTRVCAEQERSGVV